MDEVDRNARVPVDFTMDWRRKRRPHPTKPSRWVHPWTELEIVQSGAEFAVWNGRRVLADGLPSFLVARLVVRDWMRGKA